MRTRTIYFGAFLVFVFSFALRFAYVSTAVVDNPLRADAGRYFSLATNLVEHHRYSLSTDAPFLPSTYITPGYPLFLAHWISFTDSLPEFYTWVLNVQAFIGVCGAMLVFLLGLELGGLGVAVAAGLLYAISPHHVVASGYILTESLFTFLLISSTVLCLQAAKRNLWSLFFIAGAVVGFAALVRPVVLLFPLLLLPLLWRSVGSKVWSPIFVMSLGVALIWIPWQAWKSSQHTTGEPSLVTASLTLGSYPDLIYKSPEMRGFPYREDRAFDGKNLLESLELITKRAASEPGRYLYWYLVGKPVTFWGPSIIAGAGGPFIYPVTTSIYHRNPVAASSLNFMMMTHTLWVLIAAATSVWGMARLVRSRSGDNEFLILYMATILLVYFTVVHSVLAPLPRYAYPVYPFIYLLSAFGIQVAARHMRTIWQKRQQKGST